MCGPGTITRTRTPRLRAASNAWMASSSGTKYAAARSMLLLRGGDRHQVHQVHALAAARRRS